MAFVHVDVIRAGVVVKAFEFATMQADDRTLHHEPLLVASAVHVGHSATKVLCP